MKKKQYQLGQTVYHKNVYNYKEPLVVKGITETKLLLEGDYSGGTHNVNQQDWLSIEGVSFIENYGFKKQCRNSAVTISELLKPITNRNQDTITSTMFDLLDMVFALTNEV